MRGTTPEGNPLDMSSDSITITTTFHLLVPGITPAPVAPELHYEAEAPYAVAVLLHTGQGKVEWIFARRPLADGLLTSPGAGDILVRPPADAPERVLLELNA